MNVAFKQIFVSAMDTAFKQVLFCLNYEHCLRANFLHPGKVFSLQSTTVVFMMNVIFEQVFLASYEEGWVKLASSWFNLDSPTLQWLWEVGHICGQVFESHNHHCQPHLLWRSSRIEPCMFMRVEKRHWMVFKHVFLAWRWTLPIWWWWTWPLSNLFASTIQIIFDQLVLLQL